MTTNVGKPYKRKNAARQTMINRYTRINKEEYDKKEGKKAYRICRKKQMIRRKVEKIRQYTVKEYRKFL